MAQESVAVLTAVHCESGSVRAGHGLKLVLSLSPLSAEAATDVQLDLCGDVFAAMPPGTASAANWLLPLKVHGKFERCADRRSAGLAPALRFSLVLGARRLSHGTLRQRLGDLQAAGDPPFVMDLLCTYEQRPRLLCRLATRASSVLRALDSETHELDLVRPMPPALLAQADSRRSPSRLHLTLLLLRWWLFPLLFTTLCATLLLDPFWMGQVAERVLLQSLRFVRPSERRSIRTVLPPVPESMSQAFELGELCGLYFAGSPRDPALLVKAAALLSRPESLSEDELGGVLAQLKQLEHSVGLVTRVRGFFTFINTMWLLSILGIAISFGPSLAVLARPLRRLLERFARWLFHSVVKPLARRLHDLGVLEMGAWMVCGAILLEAHQHHLEELGSTTALYIAITGLAMACPALAYSTFRHAGKLKGKDPRALPRMVSAWLSITSAALAMRHDATLLGFVSVIAFFAAIGFQVASYGLCLAVGFEDDGAMERCAVTSFILLASTGALRFVNASWGFGAHLKPFRPAVSIFGCVVLFLAMLIMSSRFYRGRRGFTRSYVFINCVTLALLLGFMAMGSIGGLPGMSNTSLVFLVLWLVEKYADFHIDSGFNGWVLVLVLSVVTWRSALALHSNPEFVASLFDF